MYKDNIEVVHKVFNGVKSEEDDVLENVSVQELVRMGGELGHRFPEGLLERGK